MKYKYIYKYIYICIYIYIYIYTYIDRCRCVAKIGCRGTNIVVQQESLFGKEDLV